MMVVAMPCNGSGLPTFRSTSRSEAEGKGARAPAAATRCYTALQSTAPSRSVFDSRRQVPDGLIFPVALQLRP